MIADFDTYTRIRNACCDESTIDIDAHAELITGVAYLARGGRLLYARRGTVNAEPTAKPAKATAGSDKEGR